MKSWKPLALAAGLTGTLGLLSLSPSVYAQTRAPRATPSPLFEVLSAGSGGRIGVSVRDLDTADLKGKVSSGVAIESVDEDSPASKAGLKTGDIVVEFDGERVRSVRQFTRLVSETPEGRNVATAVLRDGQRVTVNVTPESRRATTWIDSDARRTVPQVFERFERPMVTRPMTPTPIPPAFESFVWRSGNQLGVTVNELPEQLADYFGTKDGVLVSSVMADSAAAKAGVKAGDVITSVNGSTVNDANDLRRRLADIDAGAEFSLGIVRNKQTMTVKGKLERPATPRRTSRTRVS
jgi:serine protease Do